MSGDLSSAGTGQTPGHCNEWVEFVDFNLGPESYGLELGGSSRFWPNRT